MHIGVWKNNMKKWIFSGIALTLVIMSSIPYLLYLFVDQCGVGINHIDKVFGEHI